VVEAVTVEAWVFASTLEGQDGWKMVLTHWANQAKVGSTIHRLAKIWKPLSFG